VLGLNLKNPREIKTSGLRPSFDKLMELLAIRLSPQAGKSLVIRTNGMP
jgi:hypothetical protein